MRRLFHTAQMLPALGDSPSQLQIKLGTRSCWPIQQVSHIWCHSTKRVSPPKTTGHRCQGRRSQIKCICSIQLLHSILVVTVSLWVWVVQLWTTLGIAALQQLKQVSLGQVQWLQWWMTFSYSIGASTKSHLDIVNSNRLYLRNPKWFFSLVNIVLVPFVLDLCKAYHRVEDCKVKEVVRAVNNQ